MEPVVTHAELLSARGRDESVVLWAIRQPRYERCTLGPFTRSLPSSRHGGGRGPDTEAIGEICCKEKGRLRIRFRAVAVLGQGCAGHEI